MNMDYITSLQIIWDTIFIKGDIKKKKKKPRASGKVILESSTREKPSDPHQNGLF